MSTHDEVQAALAADAQRELQQASLSELVARIRRDWAKPYFGAVPYLQALAQLDSIEQPFGADSGREMVLYFLANANTWRGIEARRIKTELKRRAGIR